MNQAEWSDVTAVLERASILKSQGLAAIATGNFSAAVNFFTLAKQAKVETRGVLEKLLRPVIH